ncbi:unnamed protein product [Phaedon cochleariae]|uniref:DUF4774 domain-containing protein n=1 Tax=Phaedon cochleariae TaxID=80249 RepID=A0A9P0DEN9_PHACE|nr:unnamed protein product [Phaedon cochleariae]
MEEIMNEEKFKNTKITILPFYGGAKGQSLQIIETPDGQLTTNIIKSPETPLEPPENAIDPSELENPSLPSKEERDDFGSSLRKIQKNTKKVVELQEIVEKNGKLTPEQDTLYKKTMEELTQAVENLKLLQEETNPPELENREGLSAWFERKTSNKNKANKKKEEEEKKKKEEEEKKKKEEVKRKEQQEQDKRREEEEKKRREEEEKKKLEEIKRKQEGEKPEEGEIEEEGDSDDTVGVNLPPADASVAEAKPVGLAVAGEGGVAVSKPLATAVVGRGGMAIARPIGTALAGVDPEQDLVPIYAENYVFAGKPKPSSGNKDSASEYLNRLISKYHQK